MKLARQCWLLPLVVVAAIVNADLHDNARDETSEFCMEDADDEGCNSRACWKAQLGQNCTAELQQYTKESPKCTEPDCGVLLQAYRFHPESVGVPRTTLNVSTPGLYADLWFSIDNMVQNTVCYSFQVQPEQDPGATMYYDCRRDRAIDNPSSPTVMTIKVKGQLVRYLFKAPNEGEIADGMRFFYYHTFVSNPTVTVQHQFLNDTYMNVTKIVNSNSLPVVSMKTLESFNDLKRSGDLTTVSLEKPLSSGMYRFTIAPIDCLEPCPQASSLEFDVEETDSSSFLVPIIILIVLTLGFLMPFAFYRQQQQILKPIVGQMLLAFEAVSVPHTEMVRALRLFLQHELEVKVHLDVTDVVETEHKNPTLWYQQTVEATSYVAVVVPPAVAPGTATGSPFQQTLALCLDLVEKRWKNMLDGKSSPDRDGCIVILLPDSDADQIPKQCRLWPRFRCPEEARALRQHLQLHGVADRQRNCFQIPLPLSCLPGSLGSTQRYEMALCRVRDAKAAEPLLQQVVVEGDSAKPAPGGDAVVVESGDTGVALDAAYGQDPKVADLKLIDDTSSSSEDDHRRDDAQVPTDEDGDVGNQAPEPELRSDSKPETERQPSWKLL